MKKIIIIAIALLSLASCKKPNTTYRVDYYFDNTEYQSDFLNVYDDVKYRSSRHTIEMVEIDGEMHEFVSGHIDDFVYDSCSEIVIEIEGYREHGGIYILDHKIPITVGTHNKIVITPEDKWIHR